MDVSSLDETTVHLLPDNLTMIQPSDMTLFTITSSDLQKDSRSQTGIQMRIKMKRKIMSEMMTTYFPSLLLMMITYATTFFKPFFFEAALSVNLTTMLVMTTIFISKMEGLPPTSATKMIDYWLILCQLVPFAQVVLLTAMEYLREEEQEEKQETEKEELQRTEPANVNLEETDPEEARTIMLMKHSKTTFVPMLTVIGRFFLVRFKPIKISFQRRRWCQ